MPGLGGRVVGEARRRTAPLIGWHLHTGERGAVVDSHVQDVIADVLAGSPRVAGDAMTDAF